MKKQLELDQAFRDAWIASVQPVQTVQPVAPKRKPIEAWENVYIYDGWRRIHLTQESASRNAAPGLIATVHLVEATEAKEIWRMLEPGEIKQDGDEVWYADKWYAAHFIGYRVALNAVRRRVKVVEVVE